MKATISDFFGSNLEQEVLDEVVILPVAIRNAGTGTITLPVGMKWTDFEYIETAIGIGSNTLPYSPHTISGKYIKSAPTAWASRAMFDDGSVYGLTIVANSASTANWWSFGVGANNYPFYMVGYKRRISRVGIDELMSAMSLPNLIANADLTDNPINQRNFNGNWSSLAVGAYGYDQWMKVSSTHIGAVIEAGKYRPSTKHTLTRDDVVIGEFMSPASGHWTVAVPFATSGKFDLYAGQFKRPWHPVLDGLQRCMEYYQVGKPEVEYLTSVYSRVSPFAARGIVHLERSVRKIVTPSVNNAHWYAASSSSWVTTGVSVSLLMRSLSTMRINLEGGANAGDYQSIITRFGYIVDASITLAELNGQIITV
ncbi:hypothetical protein ACVHO4_000963 [Vibrio cholerae]